MGRPISSRSAPARAARRAGRSPTLSTAAGCRTSLLRSGPTPTRRTSAWASSRWGSTPWPTRRDLVADLEALIDAAAPDDPLAWELAAFWRARQGVIQALVGHADAMGRRLEHSSARQVLCHGDLPTWNVLVDSGQQL
jgi:hypothetical protein